jgi:hypothetical protein
MNMKPAEGSELISLVLFNLNVSVIVHFEKCIVGLLCIKSVAAESCVD